MIQIKNLSKSFGKLQVLSSLDVDLNVDGIVAILGPNGSGKTTLIKCILGLVLPDDGVILYKNQSILGQHEYKNHITHLPQQAEFPDNLSVHELIRFMKSLRSGASEEDELVEAFDLNKDLDKRISHLSGGTKQKVNLLTALMFDPDVLILDEPTSGLDPLSIINLKRIIKQRATNNKRVIITTHIMSFAEEMADHILFLQEGRAAYFGTTDSLLSLNNAPNLESAIAYMLSDAKPKGIISK